MKRLFILALSAIIALASCTKEGNPDGKWNASLHGDTDPTLSLIFDGNKLDVYINSYGWRFEGTYTYTNNVVDYKVTKGYAALADVVKDEDGMIIEYSGGYESVNHNTLKPNAGYGWYDMLDYRPDLYEEYSEWLSKFKFEMNGEGKAESDILGMGGTFTKVK